MSPSCEKPRKSKNTSAKNVTAVVSIALNTGRASPKRPSDNAVSRLTSPWYSSSMRLMPWMM